MSVLAIAIVDLDDARLVTVHDPGYVHRLPSWADRVLDRLGDGGAFRPALRDAAAQSTQRATRVKVWSLYFAIFDAAVKMTPDEGKRIWGGQDWRRIVGRVRNGLIWDEVVDAYKGEGPIDTDVVISLYVFLTHYPRITE